LTVATDGSVSAEALIRFSLLSALSTQNDPADRASKPFSKDRDGFVIAEGAATLVLESLEAAIARGAKVLRHHEGLPAKRPIPSTAPGLRRTAARRSRRSARRLPMPAWRRAISATSMPMAPRRLRTTRWNMVRCCPCSASGIAVHSGVVEQVDDRPYADGCRCCRGGVLAADDADRHAAADDQLHNPDPSIILDVVPNVKRDAQVTAVLSNSFGFGGQNASLVMALEPA
jgi:3-oxoacyl-[acyl-carrier-protein] synthase II